MGSPAKDFADLHKKIEAELKAIEKGFDTINKGLKPVAKGALASHLDKQLVTLEKVRVGLMSAGSKMHVLKDYIPKALNKADELLRKLQEDVASDLI